MAVSQSKSDLKRQMKRFAGMKLRNLNDPNAGEPDHVTFIRNGKLTLSMAKINNENIINRQMITVPASCNHYLPIKENPMWTNMECGILLR